KMNTIMNSLPKTADTIFFKQVLKICSSLKLDSRIFYKLPNILIQIIWLVLIKFYLDKSDLVWCGFVSLIKANCYRCVKLDKSNFQLSLYMAAEINGRLQKDQKEITVNGFPIFIENQTMETII